MNNGPDRSGDIYNDDYNSLGDVTGGQVTFGDDKDHHTVHGDGWHVSWDTDNDTGEVSGDHETVHD